MMIEIDACLAARLRPLSLTAVSGTPLQTTIMGTGRCHHCGTLMGSRDLKRCASCK